SLETRARRPWQAPGGRNLRLTDTSRVSRKEFRERHDRQLQYEGPYLDPPRRAHRPLHRGGLRDRRSRPLVLRRLLGPDELRRLLLVGQVRDPCGGGQGGLGGGGARGAPARLRARAALRGAEAAGLPDPVRPAERLRDRAEPRARRGRGHPGAAAADAARPGARRPGPRVRPREEPRHPRLVDRGDDRRGDLGGREHLLLHRDLRRRGGQPARRDRLAAPDPGRSDRRVAAPARGVPPAGVPRRRDRRARPRHGRAARAGARVAGARPPGDPDAGQPGDRGALHRQSAPRCRHRRALLDASADRGADRAAAPVRRRPRPRVAIGVASAPPKSGSVARTQDALYAEIDLELSWSERDLPERERTKHVHRLHPYLGKFVPQLVETLLTRYVRAGGRVLDPFAGSGTTLVQSLESGHAATGVDVAAFNCLLMRVKTARYNEFVLEREIRDALARLEPVDGSFQGLSLEQGYIGRWFAPRAAAELLAFREIVTDYHHAAVLRVVLARAARSARLTTHFDLDFPREPQSGPYWCFKHKRECRPVERAEHFIRRYALDTLARIKKFARARDRRADAAVLHGDARVLALDGPFDAVITSPPYPGLIDYHEQHRYAYELLGLDDRRELEVGAAAAGASKAA